MNRIRLLSETVANQIAAGEVVERPASVVKELVENALDAQATRVMVEIQAGGRALIRVTDDGLGMSRDDALLCLERHATSKIQSAHDLLAVRTMGFRGEALPSIASVSQFTLTTRERGAGTPEGTQVVVQGGRVMAVRSAGCPEGTSVEVRHLFFNLPGRRKFLRAEETERVHIQHWLTLAALACPEISFLYSQDQRTLWQFPSLPPASNTAEALEQLRERMRQVHGSRETLLTVHREVAPVHPSDHDSEPVSLRVWGLIGGPGVSRATREDQHLFVNRRPIESRMLSYALLEGYHTALMKGRYPVACLFLEIDPASVDVNVHPAKREVRFRHERGVRQALIEAVRDALLAYHRPVATSPLPSAVSAISPGASLPISPALPEVATPPPVQPELMPDPSATGVLSPPRPPEATVVGMPSTPTATAPLEQPAYTPGSIERCRAASLAADARPGVETALPLLSVPLRLVGVVGRLYVVFESDRGLVLLDQHAAHERVLFEQMMRRLEAKAAPSQRLLLPETVELSVRDAQFVRENLPTLCRLGVQLSDFGERTFLLDGLPPLVRAAQARAFVIELVDALKATGQQVNSLRLGEETIAKTVCRHAVKAHDPLQGKELEQLLADLRQCAMPYTCPHGRPTLIEFNFRELERRFGRTT